jgi:hypothetical protein
MKDQTCFSVTRLGGRGWTGDEVRSRRFVAPHRGVRAAHLWQDSLLNRSIALSHASPDDSFLCGISAAALLGAPLPPHLQDCPPSNATPAGGSHLHRSTARGRRLDITADELVSVDGILVTSPARTILDLAAELSVPDLVAAGDALMRRWGTSHEELSRALTRRLRYTGKVRARDTISILTPLSESPQESRMRAIIAIGGLPVPTPQVVVHDHHGRFVARVDLGFEECRLALEYDGSHHFSPQRYQQDAARRSRLRSIGWTVLEVTAPDLVRPNSGAPIPLLGTIGEALTHLDAWHLVGHRRAQNARQGARHRPRDV